MLTEADHRGRILVTGARGYLGSVLVPLLLDARHDVVTVGRPRSPESSRLPAHPQLREFVGDVTRLDMTAFKEVDTVVWLAAAPNRPGSGRSDGPTRTVNRDAAARLARAARNCGVARFVFASSCSVYGVAQEIVDECSPVAPLTPYARAKVEAEEQLGDLACDGFQVICLRLATLFGASPSFRRDLLVNLMVVSAVSEGHVAVWPRPIRRPLLHVRDAAEAIVRSLGIPRSPGSAALVLNVVGLNTVIDELGSFVAGRLGVDLRSSAAPWDTRSYWVSGRRFAEATGKTSWLGLAEGVDEMHLYLTAQSRSVADAGLGRGL